MREGVTLGAIGLAIGVPLALGLTGMLRGMLYEVRPGDPVTLITVAAGLLATCLAAAYIPARRAARIDPSSALRYE